MKKGLALLHSLGINLQSIADNTQPRLTREQVKESLYKPIHSNHKLYKNIEHAVVKVLKKERKFYDHK